MDCISSSGKHPDYKSGVRAVAEAGALVGLAILALRLIPIAFSIRKGFEIGLSLAWAATGVGTAALFYGLRSTSKIFWTAFGGGIVLRTAVLAALMVYSWIHPLFRATSLLVSYTLGLAVLMLLEFRHLPRAGKTA